MCRRRRLCGSGTGRSPRAAGAGDVAGAGLEVAGHPLLAAAVELADDAGVVLTGRLSVAGAAVAWPIMWCWGRWCCRGRRLWRWRRGRGGRWGAIWWRSWRWRRRWCCPRRAGSGCRCGPGRRMRRAAVRSACTRGPMPGRAGTAEGAAGWVRHASGLLAAARACRGCGWGLGCAGCGRRRVRSRCRWRDSTSRRRRAGMGTGRRSGGCGRRGGAGMRCSRRCACRRRQRGRRAGSGCIRRCWMRCCTRPGWGSSARTVRGGGVRLPFAWSGVRVAGDGPAVLRARVSPAGADGVAVVAAGPDGRVAVSVERLVLRPVPAGALSGAGGVSPVVVRGGLGQDPAPAAGVRGAGGGRCWVRTAGR